MNDFLTIERFPAAMQKVERIFDVDKRFPGQVFRRPYRFYLLREFDNAMGDLILSLPQHDPVLMRENILLCVIDPDPIDHFEKKLKTIPAFYFTANVGEKKFNELCRRGLDRVGHFADSIANVSDVESYIPGSASWAMWGERQPEIAVLGLDDPELVAHLIDENGYWMDAESATDDGGFAVMPYSNRKIPEDVRAALIANYGGRADLERGLGRKVRYAWEK